MHVLIVLSSYRARPPPAPPAGTLRRLPPPQELGALYVYRGGWMGGVRRSNVRCIFFVCGQSYAKCGSGSICDAFIRPGVPLCPASSIVGNVSSGESPNGTPLCRSGRSPQPGVTASTPCYSSMVASGAEGDLEGPTLAVIAPTGPYEIQTTPPGASYKAPYSPDRPTRRPPAYSPNRPVML